MKLGLGYAVASSLVVVAAELAAAAVVVESAAAVAAVALDRPLTEGYCWESHSVVPSAAAVKLSRYLTDVASSTDAPYGDEAADQNEEHTAKDVPDLSESTVDIHTLAGLAVGALVHTCFSHADRVSEETLQRLVSSIEACGRWVDKGAACAQLQPFGPNLLDQSQSSRMLRSTFATNSASTPSSTRPKLDRTYLRWDSGQMR
jgi:hypothetical protein